jgi:hypothetical protein
MTTPRDEHRSVRMYEKVKDREYFIQRRGFLGLTHWDERVHVDRIENYLTLEVTSSQKPDKVIVNGVTYKPEKELPPSQIVKYGVINKDLF